VGVVYLMVSERVLDLLNKIFGVIIIIISVFIAMFAAFIFMCGLMYTYMFNFVFSISLYMAAVGCVLAGIHLIESDEFDKDLEVI